MRREKIFQGVLLLIIIILQLNFFSNLIWLKSGKHYKPNKSIFIKNEEIITKSCELEPKSLEGDINVNQILKASNLSELVEFYGSDRNRIGINYDRDNIKPYVNKFTSHWKKNSVEWKLWNSNDLRLVNDTKESYGHDGKRIKLGNFNLISLI